MNNNKNDNHYSQNNTQSLKKLIQLSPIKKQSVIINPHLSQIKEFHELFWGKRSSNNENKSDQIKKGSQIRLSKVAQIKNRNYNKETNQIPSYSYSLFRNFNYNIQNITNMMSSLETVTKIQQSPLMRKAQSIKRQTKQKTSQINTHQSILSSRDNARIKQIQFRRSSCICSCCGQLNLFQKYTNDLDISIIFHSRSKNKQKTTKFNDQQQTEQNEQQQQQPLIQMINSLQMDEQNDACQKKKTQTNQDITLRKNTRCLSMISLDKQNISEKMNKINYQNFQEEKFKIILRSNKFNTRVSQSIEDLQNPIQKNITTKKSQFTIYYKQIIDRNHRYNSIKQRSYQSLRQVPQKQKKIINFEELYFDIRKKTKPSRKYTHSQQSNESRQLFQITSNKF